MVNIPKNYKMNKYKEADLCLIVEGAYPYITGGVSSWLHNLVKAQSHLKIHIVALVPSPSGLKIKYELPENVVGVSNIFLCDMKQGDNKLPAIESICRRLEQPLVEIQQHGGIFELSEIVKIFTPYRKQLGKRLLLNSESAWHLLLNMYRLTMPHESFVNYFWSWRSLLGSLFAVVIAPLPKARVYHTISTGYAGLLAARAKLETGRPVILTEHGIYTNERRIEVMMADWFSAGSEDGLALHKSRVSLRDMWIDTFKSYTRACYTASDRIITLYDGNQKMQLRDGADPDKLLIVPNGVDYEQFSEFSNMQKAATPTIALIGRVVPIKDVKTYIRASKILLEDIPDLQSLIIGPTDEDPDYYQECQNVIKQLNCGKNIKFTGQARLDDYLAQIDVVVLTSISEAQPLVILEAGAAGIPAVATDVGSCKEMLLGRKYESPPLGIGGVITSLASPESTAHGIKQLLLNDGWRKQCGQVIQQRVKNMYNKKAIDEFYQMQYAEMSVKSSEKIFNRQETLWPA